GNEAIPAVRIETLESAREADPGHLQEVGMLEAVELEPRQRSHHEGEHRPEKRFLRGFVTRFRREHDGALLRGGKTTSNLEQTEIHRIPSTRFVARNACGAQWAP